MQSHRSQPSQLHPLRRYSSHRSAAGHIDNRNPVPSRHAGTGARGIFHPEDGETDPSYLRYLRLNQEIEGNIREGWDKVEELATKLDHELITFTKEDMDTLLVFAGLFSAVLTAFNIESYKSLQQDPNDVSAKVLYNLTQIVHSFIIQAPFVNSTQPLSAVYPVFTPPPTYVRINALWFSSLVFSLVTAALAMLVKQWLRQFPPNEWPKAQDRVRVRNFRHRGLVKWGVMEVATALPMFLQISLVLFFIGLGEFTRNLNHTVGKVTTSLTGVWFLALLVSTLAPIFSARCPYKTPTLKGFLDFLRGWVLPVINCLMGSLCHWPPSPLDEEDIRKDDTADLSILVAFDRYFQNKDFLGAVRDCLSGSDLNFVLDWLKPMLENRLQGTGEGLSLFWDQHQNEGQGRNGEGGIEIDEFALGKLTKPALRITVQTLFDAARRELNHCKRRSQASLRDGLPRSLKTALKAILRVGLHVPELIDPPSRFGTFMKDLLSWPPGNSTIREDLIGSVLARDWFMPPSDDSDPWITDNGLMSNIIDTALNISEPQIPREDAHQDGVPPTEPVALACAVLNLTLHTSNEVLRDLQPRITPLFTRLADSIAASRQAGNAEAQTPDQKQANCAETCLYICERLNNRPGLTTPDTTEGLIGQDLIQALRGLISPDSDTFPFAPPPPL